MFLMRYDQLLLLYAYVSVHTMVAATVFLFIIHIFCCCSFVSAVALCRQKNVQQHVVYNIHLVFINKSKRAAHVVTRYNKNWFLKTIRIKFIYDIFNSSALGIQTAIFLFDAFYIYKRAYNVGVILINVNNIVRHWSYRSTRELSLALFCVH